MFFYFIKMKSLYHKKFSNSLCLISTSNTSPLGNSCQPHIFGLCHSYAPHMLLLSLIQLIFKNTLLCAVPLYYIYIAFTLGSSSIQISKALHFSSRTTACPTISFDWARCDFQNLVLQYEEHYMLEEPKNVITFDTTITRTEVYQ